MAYRRDLAKSARRHLTAAQHLCSNTTPSQAQANKAVAGYLFGLTGEMALKQIMLNIGMPEPEEALKQEHPMYAHFPELKTQLRNSLKGRRFEPLLKYANDSRLFQNWDVKMRYAPTADIPENLVMLWKSQAEALVIEMGI